MGNELCDGEISYALRLLKIKYPGLQLTLYKGKFQDVESNIQVVHCPIRRHRITATTLNCKAGEVMIFDSLFTFCDKETIRVIYDLY